MEGDAPGGNFAFIIFVCEVAFFALFGAWSALPTGAKERIRKRIAPGVAWIRMYRDLIASRIAPFYRTGVSVEDGRYDDEVPPERLAQVVRPEVLYERAYQVSRDLDAEVQTVENALLAVLAAVAAVVVLAIDKLTDLGLFVLVPLSLAFIACCFGYLHGRVQLRFWAPPETEDPVRFLLDLIENPDEAHREGAEDLIDALGPSGRLLGRKRRWMTVAIISLMAGTLGGGVEKVVKSVNVRATDQAQGQASKASKAGQVAPPICEIVSEALCPHGPP